MVCMSFLMFELLLSPVCEALSLLIATDGDEFLSMASNMARPVLNIALSVWPGRKYGMSGIGPLVSTAAAFAILTLHFFSRRCLFIITKLVVLRHGDACLPVLTVLYAIIEIAGVFEAAGEGMRAIMPIYIGDRNNRAVLRPR